MTLILSYIVWTPSKQCLNNWPQKYLAFYFIETKNQVTYICLFRCYFSLCVSGVLVGNKSDLSARREVQASVAQEWAQSQGLEYHETSAVSAFQYGHHYYCVLV